jgi:Ca-activated chloride channel family protein
MMIKMNQIGVFNRSGAHLNCPLKSVSVQAKMNNSTAKVEVTQVFGNPSTDPLEVVYKFPLPHDASVTGFKAKLGDEEVVGEFRERDLAIQAYTDAVQNGDSAIYLESSRKDIYEISLGNVAPGSEISVQIAYTQPLQSVDDEIRWMVPTVIAPRYVPQSGSVKDPDALALQHGVTDYRLNLQLSWSTVSGLQEVVCLTHDVESLKTSSHITAKLSGSNIKLDRDVVFVAKYLGESRTGVTVAQNAEKSIRKVKFRFDSESHESVQHSDYVFLIDISGSMQGAKLTQAKKAIQLSLRHLESGDRFNVIAFDTNFECFASKPVEYSQAELEKADRWIENLRARGGTEILRPIQYVLSNYEPPVEGERIIFLFTDGEVGNEDEVIQHVQSHNSRIRLYSFGIDTAVNRLFIDGIASAGNGLSEFVLLHERIEDKVIRQFSRVHADYLKDVTLKDSNGVPLSTVTPISERIFSGDNYEWLIEGTPPQSVGHIELTGLNKHGEPWSARIEQVEIGDFELLMLEWAREKINLLENKLMMRSQSSKKEKVIRNEIVALSTEYGLMSSLTALIAIHERDNKLTGEKISVIVPVEAPHGWEFEDISDAPYSKFSTSLGVNMISHSLFDSAPLFSVRESRDDSAFNHFFDMNHNISNNTTPKKPAIDSLGDLLRFVAAKQNADGSFGSGHSQRAKTAWSIIGFLINHEITMKLYRKPLAKAAKWLVEEMKHSDSSDRLVIAVSLLLAEMHGLLATIEPVLKNALFTDSLTQLELEILHDVSTKRYESFYRHFNMEPSNLSDLTAKLFEKQGIL